jgi:hypothetical protein
MNQLFPHYSVLRQDFCFFLLIIFTVIYKIKDNIADDFNDSLCNVNVNDRGDDYSIL